MDNKKQCWGGLLSLLVASASYADFDIGGKAEFEMTAYTDEGQFVGQHYQYNTSIALEPELYWSWNERSDSVIFKPFLRGDQQDSERSHGDIRELAWIHVGEQWEFRTGIRKVFWGVTEFVHLVDIINQTDVVDSFDGEEKLGQPMFNVSRVTNWGIVDAFVLAGFRERTFPGKDGRLRSGLVVDADRAIYESSDKKQHIDVALRWSHSLDVFDVGVYWFDGTRREPILQPAIVNGDLRLLPYYPQVTQSGLDLQATIESWLWKLEAIYQTSNTDDYWASQAGFEYTFYGINNSAMDLGVLFEYGWDQRGKAAASLSQNDIYTGARLTLNDTADSTLLLGIGYDRDFYTRTLFVEASRRLSDHWTIALEAFFIEPSNHQDAVAALQKDDRLQIVLERFF
jgi:hypothetical protein